MLIAILLLQGKIDDLSVKIFLDPTLSAYKDRPNKKLHVCYSLLILSLDLI